MRWLIGLVLIALALVGADAAVRSYAESRIESRLADELGTGAAPDVSLGGWPISLRLLSGRVPVVELKAADARRGGLGIDEVSLDLRGVEMSFDTEETSGSASAKVEHGEGSAEIGFEALGNYIERRTPVTVVRLDERGITIQAAGRRITVPLLLESGDLVVRAPAIDDVSVPLPRVLEGIEYRTIELKDGMAVLTFALRNATLRSI